MAGSEDEHHGERGQQAKDKFKSWFKKLKNTPTNTGGQSSLPLRHDKLPTTGNKKIEWTETPGAQSIAPNTAQNTSLGRTSNLAATKDLERSKSSVAQTVVPPVIEPRPDTTPISRPESAQPVPSKVDLPSTSSLCAVDSTTPPTFHVDSGQPSNSLKPIDELWNEAYEELKEKEKTLMKDYEAEMSQDMTTMLGSISLALGAPELAVRRKEQMRALVEKKVVEAKKNAWKLTYGDQEVIVRDLAKPIVNLINDAEKFVDGLVSANPYASIAWVGVSLILPLFLNPSKQAASLATGLSYIGNLIVRSDMRQRLYERRYKTADSSERLREYRDTLKELYIRILKFEAKCVLYYSKHQSFRLGRDIAKWDKWDSMLRDITDQEGNYVKVYDLWKDEMAFQEFEKLSSRHAENIDLMKLISENIVGFQQAIASAQSDKNRENLIRWLSTIDPSINYTAARIKHQPDTGDWLIKKNADFKNWEKARSSFLWLNGKAGSGKTILSSSVINHLKTSYRDNPQVALAYHYFTFNDKEKEKRDIMALLRSLIKQLYCCRPNTPNAVEALHKYQEIGQNPELDELRIALVATVRGFLDVYLILDALDEYSLEVSERKMLLDFISQIQSSALDNLHLLCTSRREADIEEAFKPLFSTSTTVHIDINLINYRQKVDHDIGLHIDKTLALETYKAWSENLKKEARQALIERSDGMFQYVSCQFDALRVLPSRRDIRNALKNLPVGLDATYERILQSILPVYRKPVSNILKWLAFSLEPLSVEQLAEIFILDHDRETPFDEEARLNQPEVVLNYLPSLVTKAEMVRYSTTEKIKFVEVRLAHFSVREYLISPRIARDIAKDFSMTEIDAHLHISEACLAYHLQLSTTILVDKEQCKRFALWSYIGKYWIHHLESVPRPLWTLLAAERASQALAPSSQNLLNMIRIYDPENLGPNWDMQIVNLATPLYYLAVLGPAQLAELLLDKKANVNEISQGSIYISALAAAAAHGNIKTAKLLLDRRADINAQGGYYGGALQVAARHGDKSMVQLLLDRGADINAQGGYYGGALQVAVRLGDESIVQLLLDREADINMEGGLDGSALQAAARRGNESIVQLLLDRGADINIEGGPDGSALQAAAYEGYESIVQLLLDRGADINMEGGLDETALQAAVRRGDESMVQLLLDRGADVNIQGSLNGSALQAAAYEGYESIVQLLLDRGSDVNIQGGPDGSALQAAAYEGNETIVQLLLDRGADVNIQGGPNGTALQAAVRWGNESITQCLLDRGADVNIQGGGYGNALTLAAYFGRRGIIQLLLDAGADINAKTGISCGNALFAAIADDRIDCANLLISRGAEMWPTGQKLEQEFQRIENAEGKLVVDKLRKFQEDPSGYIAAAKAKASKEAESGDDSSEEPEQPGDSEESEESELSAESVETDESEESD